MRWTVSIIGLSETQSLSVWGAADGLLTTDIRVAAVIVYTLLRCVFNGEKVCCEMVSVH